MEVEREVLGNWERIEVTWGGFLPEKLQLLLQFPEKLNSKR